MTYALAATAPIPAVRGMAQSLHTSTETVFWVVGRRHGRPPAPLDSAYTEAFAIGAGAAVAASIAASFIPRATAKQADVAPPEPEHTRRLQVHRGSGERHRENNPG